MTASVACQIACVTFRGNRFRLQSRAGRMIEIDRSARGLEGSTGPQRARRSDIWIAKAERRITSLRRLQALAAAIALLWAFCAQDALATQDAPGEFKLTINAEIVVLSATVVDSHKALVSGLRKDDFHVYEDGVIQPIKYFSHEDIPVTVGILVDNSGSMRSKRADVIASALAFAGSSNPEDQMFVVNFNDSVTFGLPANTPFTDQREKLQAALSSVRAIGETALYDGIASALEHLQLGNRDKKVLVLLTDGGDTASKRSLAQVIEMAKRSSAIIYAIGIYDDQDGDQNPGVLKRFAKETGGEAFFPDSRKGIAAICEGIARDIRNQYTLAYVPTHQEKAGVYRAIAVKASAPGRGRLSVRTRAGYTVPSAILPAEVKATSHDVSR